MIFIEPVAQSVEHVTFNHGVQGSNPCGLTNEIKHLRLSLNFLYETQVGRREPLRWYRMADNQSQNNQRAPLIALAVVVLLFVVGWLLANELYKGGKMEDCLLSGRTNCAPIETPGR